MQEIRGTYGQHIFDITCFLERIKRFRDREFGLFRVGRMDYVWILQRFDDFQEAGIWPESGLRGADL